MTSPIALTLAMVLIAFAKAALAADSATPSGAGAPPAAGTAGSSETARGSPKGAANFTGAASLTRSNSLYNRQDGSEAASVDAGLQLGARRGNWAGSALLEASQDLRRAENSDLSGLAIQASRKNLKIARDRLILTPGLTLSLPVSKDQRLRQSFIAGTTASLRLEINPDKAAFRRLSLGTSLSATRNFHTYEQKTDGTLNTQSSSKQGVDVSYQASEKISLSAMLAHIDMFSYAGGHRESYAHSQEVGFEIIDSTNFALGHQLGGSIRKANGEDYNFQLTDDNQSVVYASLTISF
jgi:hypothetical protein